MSVNKVILVGRLGVDPELKSLDGGQSVCNMSIATSESWKDKEGNKQEKTEWHRCTAWGKTAELCGQYLKKGREVYLEGKLQTRKYEKDGVEKYATDIVVSTVQFLGGKNDATSPAPASSPEQDAGPVNEEMGF
jgi:single-strand DNA-binding protein